MFNSGAQSVGVPLQHSRKLSVCSLLAMCLILCDMLSITKAVHRYIETALNSESACAFDCLEGQWLNCGQNVDMCCGKFLG